jgi:hypothetical protein
MHFTLLRCGRLLVIAVHLTQGVIVMGLRSFGIKWFMTLSNMRMETASSSNLKIG